MTVSPSDVPRSAAATATNRWRQVAFGERTPRSRCEAKMAALADVNESVASTLLI